MNKFIAAMDHSGGSTGGVLERYEQEYTEDNKMALVNDMRLRMINSPKFNDTYIWGSILYKDSVDRGLSHHIKSKGIKTFLKVDSGCEDNGYLKYFRVDDMIIYAHEHGCYGTKMRSIVKSPDTIEMILTQQFALAEKISDSGLVPIIEPEVPIDYGNKQELEGLLSTALAERLVTYTGKCILKLTLPETTNLYLGFANHPKVERVVGLSGGYSTLQACDRLGQQDKVSASFSRALSEGLYAHQTDDQFNEKISDNIKRISNAS